jgi:hypothetical protein
MFIKDGSAVLQGGLDSRVKTHRIAAAPPHDRSPILLGLPAAWPPDTRVQRGKADLDAGAAPQQSGRSSCSTEP